MWNRYISSTLLSGLLVFGAGNSFAQSSHTNVVAQKKAILLSLGESLSGACGAFKITREVAADPVVRAEGWGLVAKPISSDSGCLVNGQRYSADALMQPGGFTVDILRRAESDEGDTTNNNNFNIPDWSPTGSQLSENWRAPLTSALVSLPPTLPPVTPPSTTPVPVPVPVLDLTGVYERLRTSDDAKERQYLDLTQQNRRLSEQVAGVSAQVKAHDERVSGIISFLTDGKTVTGIITALGGLALQRYVLASPVAPVAPPSQPKP